MGNYKFKISDMIPNAWFHKLKDMTKSTNKLYSSSSSLNTCCSKKKSPSNSLPHHSSASSITNTLLASNPHHNSPRNSLHTRRMSKRKILYMPSLKPLTPSLGFNKSKIYGQDFSDYLSPALESSPESFVYSFYKEESDPFDFKINTKKDRHKTKESDPTEKTCSASNLTKKPRIGALYVNINKGIEEEEDKFHKKVSSGRKSSSGINLKRVNSPRIQLSSTRRSTSRSERKQAVLESFAVVKRSVDPRRDFKESMVEMIEENNIKSSKDLEDLLTCYLSLNPKEYHALIIQVFEQIWLQLT